MISVGPNCSFCYIDPHVCMCQSRMSRSCPCHRTSWELAKVVASQFSQCLGEIVVSIHFYHCKQVWYLGYQFLRHNSPYQDQATMPLTNSRKMGSTTFNSTWSWTSRVARLWYQGNWVCWQIYKSLSIGSKVLTGIDLAGIQGGFLNWLLLVGCKPESGTIF